MEERFDRIKRFSEMHVKARKFAGKSQEYMALELCVSKKTVQNWEKGISQPTFFQSLEWFRVLNLNPFPYYLEYYYKKPNDTPTDDDIEKQWNELTTVMPTFVKRAILFIFFGRHGSSPISIVQLTLAHIHSPLKSRVINAINIEHNYNMAKATDELICTENIMPDMNMLNESISLGKESAINNQYGYFQTEKEGH